MDFINIVISYSFWQEVTSGTLNLLWIVVRVVVPVFIFLEILKDLKWLDKLSELLAPTVKVFGISKEGSLPMVVGVIIGIAYGAAIIIHAAKEGKLTKRELNLILLFLVINHAVIEDNFLFYSVGASFWDLFFLRFLVAFVVTYIASKILKETKREDAEKEIVEEGKYNNEYLIKNENKCS